jgi:UPF0716 family protein affecting phage T7 exclusion
MFKYIFIVAAILILIPPVRRWLFWLVVGRQLVKEQKKQTQQRSKAQKKKGDVNIDYVPSDGNKDDFKGGEYVDFEEVKD